MGPARCCLGFSFWLVRPLPLWDIWFSSGTGKLNNFNKAERKHNDFGGRGGGGGKVPIDVCLFFKRGY